MPRKKKRDSVATTGGFLAMPKLLMEHRDFRELSPSALKVLMVLGSQYDGFNNGDLSATHSMMEDWGGMAKATLAKSLRELQERQLIVKTRDNRYGREGARCALFALAWLAIHDCPGKGLDTPPSIVARRKLSKA
ncbi:MarR family transcriptional regulator [Halomonas sp. NYA30]